MQPAATRAVQASASSWPLDTEQRRRPRWWREPLLHFVLLGGLLFAADHLLQLGRDDPRTIVIGSSVDQQARQLFEGVRGREPESDELKAMRERWLDNEVLYREGLALQLDRGDATIRERVIFKSLSVIEAGLKLPAHDEASLRVWFEARRDKYDEPARLDFQEAVLSGEATEAAVRAFVERPNLGLPGQTEAGLRLFKGRPQASLAQSFGPGFALALATAPLGQWQARHSSEGWRAVRLDAVSAARPARFESLRGVLLQDWTDATMAEQRSAAVRALASKYRVRFEQVAS